MPGPTPGGRSRRVEHQHLGGALPDERELRLLAHRGAVAVLEPLAVQVDGAARDVHPRVPPRREAVKLEFDLAKSVTRVRARESPVAAGTGGTGPCGPAARVLGGCQGGARRVATR